MFIKHALNVSWKRYGLKMSRNWQLNASKFFRYHSLERFSLEQPNTKINISVRILNQPGTENLLRV